MKTIKDGEEQYEVLAIEDILRVTHAKFSGLDDIFTAYYSYQNSHGIWVKEPEGNMWYPIHNIKKHSIQLLRLIEREPITFKFKGDDAEFIETHTVDNHGHESPRGYYAIRIPTGIDHRGKHFVCTEEVNK